VLPSGGFSRVFGQRALDLVVIDGTRTTRTRRVSKPVKTPLTETAPPQAHGEKRHAEDERSG